MVFITGGAGFIGSNFIHYWLKHSSEPILNIDKLTYAGNLENLKSVEKNPNYLFSKLDICSPDIGELFRKYQPTALFHFAAESHVDRSISGPAEFIQTNVFGTFNLLESVRKYLEENSKMHDRFRFVHVSTDEVYGTLKKEDDAFEETTPFAPNSPYSASKASSDHLIRAYFHTYKIPGIVTHCSNNYGPFQYPEKFIPVIIQACLENKPIPIYGDGSNIRDWLHVDDHCAALSTIQQKGLLGETYNIGGQCEVSNLSLVDLICEIMNELKPRADKAKYQQQKTFVTDRKGHDWRYAINISKISRELGWSPKIAFSKGLRETVAWYLENQNWIQDLRKKSATASAT